ncbi:unnamed protein product [Brassica rapa subsp. trilocularis]
MDRRNTIMPIISMNGLLLLHHKSAVRPEELCLYVFYDVCFLVSRGRRVYNSNLEQKRMTRVVDEGKLGCMKRGSGVG